MSLPTAKVEVKRYTEAGWVPVPLCKPVGPGRCAQHGDCQRAGKRPLVAWGRAKRPSERTIKHWWSQNPGANVGLLLKPSGLLVIDKDDPDLQLRVPVTPTSRTGRSEDARHYYFRATREFQRNLHGGGISVLVDGIAVAPSSTHASGAQYEWLIAPTEAEPIELPPWTLESIEPHLHRKRGTEAPADGHTRSVNTAATCVLTEIVHGVPEGRRNVSAARLAGKLLGALDPKDWESVVWPLLVAWNNQNCPPLELSELREVYESIARRELLKHLRTPEEQKLFAKIKAKLRENPSVTDRRLYQVLNARRAGLRMHQFARLATLARLSQPPTPPITHWYVVSPRRRVCNDGNRTNTNRMRDYTP